MAGQPAQQRIARKLSICFSDVHLAFAGDDGIRRWVGPISYILSRGLTSMLSLDQNGKR